MLHTLCFSWHSGVRESSVSEWRWNTGQFNSGLQCDYSAPNSPWVNSVLVWWMSWDPPKCSPEIKLQPHPYQSMFHTSLTPIAPQGLRACLDGLLSFQLEMWMMSWSLDRRVPESHAWWVTTTKCNLPPGGVVWLTDTTNTTISSLCSPIRAMWTWAPWITNGRCHAESNPAAAEDWWCHSLLLLHIWTGFSLTACHMLIPQFFTPRN